MPSRPGVRGAFITPGSWGASLHCPRMRARSEDNPPADLLGRSSARALARYPCGKQFTTHAQRKSFVLDLRPSPAPQLHKHPLPSAPEDPPVPQPRITPCLCPSPPQLRNTCPPAGPSIVEYRSWPMTVTLTPKNSIRGVNGGVCLTMSHLQIAGIQHCCHTQRVMHASPSVSNFTFEGQAVKSAGKRQAGFADMTSNLVKQP